MKGQNFSEKEKEILRREVKPDYSATPIRQGETLEPCLRGAQKIFEDEAKLEMMRRIYRGEKKQE